MQQWTTIAQGGREGWDEARKQSRSTAMQLINLREHFADFQFYPVYRASLILLCDHICLFRLCLRVENSFKKVPASHHSVHLSAGNGNYSLSLPVFLAVPQGTMKKAQWVQEESLHRVIEGFTREDRGKNQLKVSTAAWEQSIVSSGTAGR